jgi:hypothetical protein
MDMKTHTFFFSGKGGGKHEYGVVFAVKKDVRHNSLDSKGINERMCSLSIKTKFGNLSVMNVSIHTKRRIG